MVASEVELVGLADCATLVELSVGRGTLCTIVRDAWPSDKLFPLTIFYGEEVVVERREKAGGWLLYRRK
jgi:hypothetical protein